MEDDLTLEKAIIEDDLSEKTGHSYTLSVVQPCKRVALVLRSFTQKEVGKNSMDVLLDWQNWEMEIRFFFIVGTQRTLSNLKIWERVERDLKLVWVIGRPVSSLITMSSALYRKHECRGCSN